MLENIPWVCLVTGKSELGGLLFKQTAFDKYFIFHSQK